MDNLDMAIELLLQAKREKELMTQYEADLKKLPRYDEPDPARLHEKFWQKWRRTPKNSVINDNVKMARRLLLSEYR